MLCTLTYHLLDITKGKEVAEVLVDSISTSVLLNQNQFHSKQPELYAANWEAAPKEEYTAHCQAGSSFVPKLKCSFRTRKMMQSTVKLQTD